MHSLLNRRRQRGREERPVLVKTYRLLCVERRWDMQPRELLLARRARHDGRTRRGTSSKSMRAAARDFGRACDDSAGYTEGRGGIACRGPRRGGGTCVERETPIFLVSSQPRGFGMESPAVTFLGNAPTHALTAAASRDRLALSSILVQPRSFTLSLYSHRVLRG